MDAERVSSLICTSVALASPTLDLSAKNLTELPDELYTARHIECLYLENNSLMSIPHELFESLSNLRWLDLRNNRITDLPSSIGSLKHLRALLVEGNNLENLPPELGKLTTLTGLNLTGNPLRSPPETVVKKGTQAVLQYLRGLLPSGSHTRADFSPETPPFLPPAQSSLSRRASVQFRPSNTVAAKSSVPEKTSSPFDDDDDDETAPFLPAPAPQRLQLQPVEPRRPFKAAIFRPRLRKARQPVVGNMVGPKQAARAEESRALQKVAKVQAGIAKEEQKNKDKKILSEWRDERKREQTRRTKSVKTQLPRPSVKVPYATEEEKLPSVTPANNQEVLSSQTSSSSFVASQAAREARERELAEKIRRHTTRIRQALHASGTSPHQRLAADIVDDIRTAEEYLDEVQEKRREYRLTAFTGDDVSYVLDKHRV